MANRRQKVTDEEIIDLLKSGIRPVWTATNLSEYFDITRQTAHQRLKKLAENNTDVDSAPVGRSTGYFAPGTVCLPYADTEEERFKRSLIHHFTDEFVGLHTAPWTAIHPNDGGAEEGDKIQITVHGEPGHWSEFLRRKWENRRERLEPEEIDGHEAQALISGELYEKPTVPIRHINYPDDYDLELNIGAEFKGEPPKQALIAAGVKNYLIRPCDDAVFLKNVEVDWISLPGDGQEIPHSRIGDEDRESMSMEEMEELVEEWREEHVKDDPDPI